jgi:DNA-binding response OmpR family regulator
MGSKPVVLLVEGRNAGMDSVAPALKKASYELCIVYTGDAALNLAGNQEPDIIIFDASTMRSNGVRSCRRLRRTLKKTPIIHSRPGGMPLDRTAEADVYLERPYSPRKLLNRVRALLPPDDEKEEVVRYGYLTFFRNKQSVDVAGRGEYSLTPKLAALLDLFFRHCDELISREKLMKDVWETTFLDDTRTLDVHVSWIRKRIELDPGRPRVLRTVRGKGYIFGMVGQDHTESGPGAGDQAS